MHHLLRTSLLLLTVTACTDLLPPPGIDAYEYRIFDNGGGTPAPLAFHWPRSSLPVTVYVDSDSPLRASVVRAIDAWQDAFVYGELRMALTSDSTRADIIVRNESATKATTSIRLAGAADGCVGSTDFDANLAEGTLELPFRIRIATLTLPTNPILPACFDATVLHEMGHAIGIFAHSSDGADVMNVNPTRGDLSARDKATVEAAYHLPVTLAPVR